MSKALFLTTCLLIASGMAVQAVGFGPVALGFHLIPSVEEKHGHRAWDLSLSLGITVDLGASDSVELSAIIDSKPTALGTTVTYRHDVTDILVLGAGLTALWPITSDAQVQTPLFESFALVIASADVASGLTGEASASLPVLTLAKVTDRWTVIPLAELPSVALAGDFRLAVHGSLKLELTLQPVITDTTALVEPFGRVTDDLLILPMLSAYTRFVP
jgi:hypothetical protein